MAVVMELIICEIRQSKFSYLHFACFLLLPPILLETSVLTQCDAIYTTFALLAFYFALKHRSIPCFICLGLSFAIKLQFLLIVPMIFIMLIIKDKDGKKYLSWKWVWLAPCMYIINFIPLFCGESLINLLKVYFLQFDIVKQLSMNSDNLPWLFDYFLDFPYNYSVYLILVVVFSIIGISLTIGLLFLILRVNHRQTLTTIDIVRYALCFAMMMVYFMPKMHDRYFFIGFVLSIIWLITEPSKWHSLIGAMISTALGFSFLNETFLCYELLINLGYIKVNNKLFLSIYKKVRNLKFFSFILNTIVLISLITPIIINEVKTHKKQKLSWKIDKKIEQQ